MTTVTLMTILNNTEKRTFNHVITEDQVIQVINEKENNLSSTRTILTQSPTKRMYNKRTEQLF